MPADIIQMIVYLGVLAIAVVVVIAVLQHMGIVIPQIVYIIIGGVVGILLLLWIAGMLTRALPG